MATITRDPLDAAALLRAVTSEAHGANLLFFGSVRAGPDDGRVAAIDYSAYEEMAVEEFDRVLAEARQRWPTVRCAACHRVGRIPLGEPSIGVAVGAPHRAEAFAAARWVIDEAKRRLPVWKREEFVDGSRRWREDDSTVEQTPAEGR